MNRFCTACGKAIDDEASFCGACGKSVKGATAAAPLEEQSAQTANGSTSPTSPPVSPLAGKSASEAAPARPVRPAADLPPESVFAGGAGAAGGGIPPEADPAYFEVGEEGDDNSKLKLFVAGAVLILLLLAGLYFLLRGGDDPAEEGGRPTAVAEEQVEEEEAPAAVLFYASSTANIREAARTDGAKIRGKLTRGDEARGIVVEGEGGAGGEWLKLEDDQGYVFLANLTQSKMPTFTDKGRRKITLASAAKLLAAPSSDAAVLDDLSKGLELTISGIVEGGYAEVLLRKGGVGYIAGGEKLMAANTGPKGSAIAIKLNEQGCAGGTEVDQLFKKLDGRIAATLQKVEDADYPDDAARKAAMNAHYNKVEGTTEFEKLQRSFKGLQVSGIARHYESQSIYFAEPVAKVRKAFRDAGYKVRDDGQLPSEDISAGIYSVRGDAKAYGATALECGV